MIKALRRFFKDFFSKFFKKRKDLKLGLYGPPNSGKCVTPETRIILQNGEITQIKDIFNEAKEKVDKFNLKDFKEIYLDTTDLNLIVPSFDIKSLKIIPKKVSFVYAQKYKGKIYSIETRSGRKIRITPEHPLIKISNKGIEETKSKNLKEKNCIAIAKNTSPIKTYQRVPNNGMIQVMCHSKYILSKDEIKEIKEKNYNGYVYDLTIEDTHTFLISNGLIAHNTTLANRICQDWLGEEMGKVSKIPHETREIQMKEKVTVESGNKKITFSLIDTPGIATKIDYEDFIKVGLKKKDAQKRAKEATRGVIEAIKWLDSMNCVLVILDSTQDPYSQVNITIIGNLAARDIPVLVIGNKIDLKKSDIKKVEAAFPQYKIIGISAEYGDNIDELYESLFKLVK